MNSNITTSLQWRYAVKRFDASKKISAQDWETLESSLVLSPSSYGLQPWKFIVVKNQEIKDYNDFIVQVYWSNPELSTYADIKKSQMGAIKDIVLSIDKSF